MHTLTLSSPHVERLLAFSKRLSFSGEQRQKGRALSSLLLCPHASRLDKCIILHYSRGQWKCCIYTFLLHPIYTSSSLISYFLFTLKARFTIHPSPPLPPHLSIIFFGICSIFLFHAADPWLPSTFSSNLYSRCLPFVYDDLHVHMRCPLSVHHWAPPSPNIVLMLLYGSSDLIIISVILFVVAFKFSRNPFIGLCAKKLLSWTIYLAHS